jgi:hypothetical protein
MTTSRIRNTLVTGLAPLLPHLAEEASLAQPALPSPAQLGWHASPLFRNQALSPRSVSIGLFYSCSLKGTGSPDGLRYF